MGTGKGEDARGHDPTPRDGSSDEGRCGTKLMKANISVAIIARNAAHTIAACLDSVVQSVEEVVVCVDALTTDNTAAVAREHGAGVYEGLEVSSYRSEEHTSELQS